MVPWTTSEKRTTANVATRSGCLYSAGKSGSPTSQSTSAIGIDPRSPPQNRTCAQLDVDIDISELDVPAELEGSYHCSVKGQSVFFFDVSERCFVSGETALLMRVDVDAPMPSMSVGGKDEPELPERAQMDMFMDTLMRVTLQD